ncbi:MAG: 3-hydroxyisobutyrate dehydrogenase [Methylocystis sp.]
MTPIAFIGLGNMGGPMAANLARAGFDPRGFDLRPAARDSAAKDGVKIAGSAREATAGADVVITMLPAGAHVLSVWTDLLPCANEGALFIDCSTIDIDSARQAHEIAREAGARSVDAPVSGGVASAKAGTLTFMCGGDATAFAAAKPILEAMGKAILYCGGPGLGQAAKICNNMMLGVTMIVTSEAFALAEKLGLSDQALFDAASVSSGQSWSLTRYCPAPGLTPSSPANFGYKPGFMAALMLKDLKLAQEAAASVGASTPLGAMAAQLYGLYVASGDGGSDFSGVIEMIRGRPRNQSPPPRVG